MARYKESDVTPFTGLPAQPATLTRLPTSDRPLGRQNRIAAQLLGLGYPVEEVATDTGLSVPHLKVLLRSRLFQVEMARCRERFVANAAKEIREKVYAKGDKALAAIDDMLDDPHHKDRLGAAREILGRIMPLKTEGSRAEPTVVINISSEKMASIETTLAEIEEAVIEHGTSIGESSGPGGEPTRTSGSTGAASGDGRGDELDADDAGDD